MESNYTDEDDEGERGSLDVFDCVYISHYVRALVDTSYTLSTDAYIILGHLKNWQRMSLTLKVNHCKIVLPTKKASILKFKNFYHRNQVPFVVYADFDGLTGE